MKLASKFFEVIIAEKYYERRFPNSTKILNYPLKDKLTLGNNDKIEELDNSKLLYTGNITEDRGALNHAKILNYIENVELYMVGKCSKDLAEKIKNRVSNNSNQFHLEGEGKYVPYENILKYYKEGNWLAGLAIFPQTSHYNEKELTKFFEYMAAGIPIICSDFTVWRKLIEETGTGIVVDQNNIKSIIEAIQYLKNNPLVAKKMGEKGKKVVQKRYNWAIEENKLLNLYKKILNDINPL